MYGVAICAPFQIRSGPGMFPNISENDFSNRSLRKKLGQKQRGQNQSTLPHFESCFDIPIRDRLRLGQFTEMGYQIINNRVADRTFVRFRLWVVLICSRCFQPGMTTFATDETSDEIEQFATRLFIAHLDGSNMRPGVDRPDLQAQGSPCWPQDGKRIAFALENAAE